jgi:hypothetical protein
MSIFNCNWNDRCERKPYKEIHYSLSEDDSRWCYVCFWHYIIARIHRLLGKKDFAWCRIDTDREVIEQLKYDMWDIQADLDEIKEKLGIKDETLDEIQRNIDVT